MAHYILSAFADEVSSDFTKQLEYLKSKDISYIEPRNINGTGVAAITLEEAKNAKKMLR